MVFIVKIPNRSRANTPEALNAPSSEVPPQATARVDACTPPHASSSSNGYLHVSGDTGHSEAVLNSVLDSKSSSDLIPAAAVQLQPPAELDVLLAPSVLHHRYVRGVDKSLIVERPERIRAVLLGVATAIGKSSSGQHPPIPASTFGSQSSADQPSQNASHAHHSSGLGVPDSYSTGEAFSSASSKQAQASSRLPAVPYVSTPALDDDDLVARLSSLSVQNGTGAPPSPAQPQQKFRVLHSTRSLHLNPPHPAVAFAHAHSDELVSMRVSAYDQAKQKRRDALADASNSASLQVSEDEYKVELQATQTPSSMASLPQTETCPSSSRTSHSAYLEHLCNRAPNHPPLSQPKPHYTPSSKSIPEDSEAYTSSDGEGEDAMHLSEVPDHLPQGDLYLAGPSREGSMDGGSAEAIRHAMGACCEAVDRVVLATSTDSTSPRSSPLQEIKYGASHVMTPSHASERPMNISSTDAAAPAKRAFVLCRPPGHHCSGSTPQGFCWVNNAIVASAHAYLEHGIDRIVIFDIDLHHGNGTQNLAWRINADANKHDDERAEKLAGLRAAALDRARKALGSGSGRAHASRLAKVTLSEKDEAEMKRQAGPRALRLFYSSLHDIESFPCEDGDPGMIKDASTCVEGAHGQWIWNIHLDHYRSESDFKQLYDEKYKIVFSKAARFLFATSATPQNTLILISAGFDACSYEYPGMQRHGKHVPPSFYHTFARDAVNFTETHAQGKLISVLEGGYSDRALCSAALAHVTGLAVRSAAPVGSDEGEGEAEYWKLENLIAAEKVAKKMAAHAAAASVGGAGSTNTTPKRRQAELAPWLSLTSRAFAAFEQACGKENVVPLGSPASTSRGAAASGRASTATSAANSPATMSTGRVLRDRGALKSRPAFEGASTLQAHASRRAASPTKATPTRAGGKKETPSKRVSPNKATSAANVLFGPVTPLKEEARGEDSMSMDADTPTRFTVASLSSNVAMQAVAIPSTSNLGHPSTPQKVQQQQQQQQQVAPPQSATILPTEPAPVASDELPPPEIAPVKSELLLGSERWLPPNDTRSSSGNFIATYSAPPSPALTAAPVTLVDAVSRTGQIIDANTHHIVASEDPLREEAFHLENGAEGGEEDAPGSPDPEVLHTGRANQGHFNMKMEQQKVNRCQAD